MIDLNWGVSEKNPQIPRQDDFILVLYSLKHRKRKEYNTNLCQFLDFRKEEEATIERTEKFDRIILHYIHYVFD